MPFLLLQVWLKFNEVEDVASKYDTDTIQKAIDFCKANSALVNVSTTGTGTSQLGGQMFEKVCDLVTETKMSPNFQKKLKDSKLIDKLVSQASLQAYVDKNHKAGIKRKRNFVSLTDEDKAKINEKCMEDYVDIVTGNASISTVKRVRPNKI